MVKRVGSAIYKFFMMLAIMIIVILLVISFVLLFKKPFSEVEIYKYIFVDGRTLEVLSFLSTYLGGILTPILTLASIYYIVQTIKQQTQSVNQQSFESTLNLLFEQHNLIVGDISERKNTVELSTGHKVESKLTNKTLLEMQSGKYQEDVLLNRYNRVLYQILKHIDDSDAVDKHKYTRILRSFIPNDILIIVAYNACRKSVVPKNKVDMENVHDSNENVEIETEEKYDFKEYMGYIEKYELLEHLVFDDANNRINYFNPDNLKKLPSAYLLTEYSENAFGDKINMNNALRDLCVQFGNDAKFISVVKVDEVVEYLDAVVQGLNSNDEEIFFSTESLDLPVNEIVKGPQIKGGKFYKRKEVSSLVSSLDFDVEKCEEIQKKLDSKIKELNDFHNFLVKYNSFLNYPTAKESHDSYVIFNTKEVEVFNFRMAMSKIETIIKNIKK